MEKSTQTFMTLKEGFYCICLSVILIVSVYRISKNYYLQMLSEECKYIVKEKKMTKYLADAIEILPDDSDEENSDEENSNKENYNEENSDEESFNEKY